MKEFVDLTGASGSTYRFRQVAKGVTPLRIAGNFAVLKRRGEGFAVVHLAMTNDLSRIREETPPAAGRGPFFTYIRLNVARSLRETEHEDLSANYGPKQQVAAE